LGDGKALAHGYRALQHWNQWLAQHFLGIKLLENEEKHLCGLLETHFGKHVALVGVPQQFKLLNATKIPCHSLITPMMFREHQGEYQYIEGDFHELPVLTGSVDLVLLPHTLEFIDNPRQLLAEACRIIKPEGLIVISGFNPYGSWGLKHKTQKSWKANLIRPRKVISWLGLADFEVEKLESILYTPPITKPGLFEKLQFLEKIGRYCFPKLGGVYILVARAKVIPLTPIRLKWKQQLSSIRVPTTISGHTARQSK
jgi:SAM-dependent methyltransferase